jgi:hypothetical protein
MFFEFLLGLVLSPVGVYIFLSPPGKLLSEGHDLLCLTTRQSAFFIIFTRPLSRQDRSLYTLRSAALSEWISNHSHKYFKLLMQQELFSKPWVSFEQAKHASTSNKISAAPHR